MADSSLHQPDGEPRLRSISTPLGPSLLQSRQLRLSSVNARLKRDGFRLPNCVTNAARNCSYLVPGRRLSDR
jgi:hypothetical protein